MQELKTLAPNVDPGKLSQLLSCCHALVTEEAINLGLPDFPLDNVTSAAFILVMYYKKLLILIFILELIQFFLILK